jgi:hypothetical protein
MCKYMIGFLIVPYFQPVRAFESNSLNTRPKRPLPTREAQLKSLRTEAFDVLVIGGGATGSGCALDSVSRGTNLFSIL